MIKAVNVLLVASALMLSGCTSALKKQCEKTNWFEHGHSAAMSGKRLNSDDLAQRCEKENVAVIDNCTNKDACFWSLLAANFRHRKNTSTWL